MAQKRKADPKRSWVNRKATKKMLGARVRFEMEQRGWSQNDLAFYSGISQGTVSRICRRRGKMLNNAEMVLRIAMAFGVSMDYLLAFRPKGVVKSQSGRARARAG